VEDPVRHVPTGATAPTTGPTDPAAEPATAAEVRRAVHDLRVAAERPGAAIPAWATRTRPAPAGPGASRGDGPADASDPLVGLLAQLRAVTTRYVRGLRAGGARPEQMLVRVKELLNEAMTSDGWRDPAAATALTAEVVRWSIAAYYDG
jgi:hypothetical protein